MDEHAYFRAIEERFIELRGAPLLLSPADYQVAKRWWSEGIPLEVVCGALEEAFARRAERGAAGPVQSLRYCAPAVEAAWQGARDRRRADRRETVAPLDVEARLEALAAALPDSLADVERWRSRVRALSGSADQVEGRLAELEARLLVAVAEGLQPAERVALAERVERGLGALDRRVGEAELETTRSRLFEQALRRARGLPVLSLFAES